MDIEELNRSQIILLTLLVSFVTSIATGIVTVSLMEQAPPALTQTVNRVVERTVEKVVPEGQGASAAITTEKTVVVKESDLLVEAVKKITPSLVQVFTSGSEGTFLGTGFVIDKNGRIVVDAATLGETSEYVVELPGNVRVGASVVSRDQAAGVAILKASAQTSDGTAIQFSPATLAVESPPLGQTVVVISGRNIPRIADGIVTAHIPQGEGKNPMIDTNVSPDLILGGSPLVNTDGSVLGVSTSVARASSGGAFISSSALVKSDTGSQ